MKGKRVRPPRIDLFSPGSLLGQTMDWLEVAYNRERVLSGERAAYITALHAIAGMVLIGDWRAPTKS
jgi:hypothetical protein